jgi:hypothetical protein
MKSKSARLIVAAIAVAAMVSGCAASERPPMRSAMGATGSGGDENKYCEWTFDYALDKSGKIHNLKVKAKGADPKDCTIEMVSRDKFYMGEHGKETKVLDISAAEIILEGSCKRCYVDTSGGLTCVVYPSC